MEALQSTEEGSGVGERIASYRQAGIYDTGILGPVCDNRLSDLDQYGFQILGEPSLSQPLRYPESDGEIWGYRLTCDTDKRRGPLALTKTA